jgi:hypothetical protein
VTDPEVAYWQGFGEGLLDGFRRHASAPFRKWFGFSGGTGFLIDSSDELTEAGKFFVDIKFIQDIALNYGVLLGEWIHDSSMSGHVDVAAPIHLIGHSAGGFVVGEAALSLSLRSEPVDVDLVTMLDTPLPWLAHVSVLPDPTYVERYITSILGLAAFPEVQQVPYNADNPFFRYGEAGNKGGSADLVDAHAEAHRWYLRTIQDPDDSTGFQWSPFASGPRAAEMIILTPTPRLSPPPANGVWDDFQHFGGVVVENDLCTLAEQSDAGVYKNIQIPVGGTSMNFSYRFIGHSDGDFLQVTYGSNLLYTSPSTRATQEIFYPVSIPISEYAGEAQQLVITLVSRGEANASVTLRDFVVDEVSDADYDGLTNEDEIGHGTNPLRWDTDGDFVGDSGEISAGTNPLRTDTDGDGQSDYAEQLAGTDPLDSSSVLRIEKLALDGAKAVVEWESVLGRSYSLLWSDDLNFENSEPLAPSFQGTGERMSFSDFFNSPFEERGFFWIEVSKDGTE